MISFQLQLALDGLNAARKLATPSVGDGGLASACNRLLPLFQGDDALGELEERGQACDRGGGAPLPLDRLDLAFGESPEACERILLPPRRTLRHLLRPFAE